MTNEAQPERDQMPEEKTFSTRQAAEAVAIELANEHARIDAILKSHEESFRGNATGYVRAIIGECRRLIREGT